MGRIVVIALFEAGFSKLYPVVCAYTEHKSHNISTVVGQRNTRLHGTRLSTPELLGPSSICTNSSKLMAPSFAKSWNMRARAIKHSKHLTRMQTHRCAAKGAPGPGCGQHSMIQDTACRDQIRSCQIADWAYCFIDEIRSNLFQGLPFPTLPMNTTSCHLKTKN